MIGDLLAVLTGENFGALTEPRTDSRKRVAIGGREIELSTNDSMRQRRKRWAPLCWQRREKAVRLMKDWARQQDSRRPHWRRWLRARTRRVPRRLRSLFFESSSSHFNCDEFWK